MNEMGMQMLLRVAGDRVVSAAAAPLRERPHRGMAPAPGSTRTRRQLRRRAGAVVRPEAPLPRQEHPETGHAPQRRELAGVGSPERPETGHAPQGRELAGVG
jgi:hypothetical protein